MPLFSSSEDEFEDEVEVNFFFGFFSNRKLALAGLVSKGWTLGPTALATLREYCIEKLTKSNLKYLVILLLYEAQFGY